jgi:pimeloyl-ACP methyl ester carboxylesterase
MSTHFHSFGMGLAPTIEHGLVVPALIVHGTLDKNVPFEHATQLAAVIPHAKLVAIPGVDHLGLFWRTDVLTKQIDAFVSNLGDDSGLG